MAKAIRSSSELTFPWKTPDPFLFCAYHADHYPSGNSDLGPDASLEGRNLGQDFQGKDGWNMYHGKTVPGFPAHPHRGFETVTIVKQGLVDHSDSLGAAGRFGNGDVQWMTAGKGVQHSEMFPLLNQNSSNPFVLFQIWLNLPKKNKLVEPHFKMLWKEDIPKVVFEGEKSSAEVDIIAGRLGEIEGAKPAPNSWAANPENEVAIWTISMDPHSRIEIPAASSKEVNRSLFFYKGNTASIDGETMKEGTQFEMNPTEGFSIVNDDVRAYFLLLQGKPIEEQVAQYGPFVMNTQAEIKEAFEEFQETQFGGWPWPSHDHVHEAVKGRFAKHADGKLETRD